MLTKGKIAGLMLASAVAGGALVIGYFKIQPDSALAVAKTEKKAASPQTQFDSIIEDQRNLFKNFDSMFDDDFFRQGDPFEEMRKFRERMGKAFPYKNLDPFSASPFDSWFGDRFGGGSVSDIKQREDDKHVYYEIQLNGVEGESVRTRVEDGRLTITGEVRKEEGKAGEDGSTRSFYSSSFVRSFPLPEGVDAEKMEMTTEKNKIVVKLPKVALPSPGAT